MLSPRWRMRKERFARYWKRRRRSIFRLVLSVAAAALCPNVLHSTLGTFVESALLRGYFVATGSRPVPSQVVILQVDNRTKRYLGVRDNESIPRLALAQALERLALYRPKAVIFDATMQDPGPDPDVDERLAAALAKTPSVIGRRSTIRVEKRAGDGKPITTREVSNPLPLFARAAKYVFPIQLTLTANVAQRIALLGNPSVEKIPLLEPLRGLVDPSIPHPGDSDLINYYGPPSTIPALPLPRLLASDDSLSPDLLSEKVVLIGWTDPTVNTLGSPGMDTFLTPASLLPMYGVEIHATIAANLLERSWLRRLDPLTEVVVYFAATFLLVFLACSLPWSRAVVYVMGIAAVAVLSSYLVFLRFHYFVPVATLFAVILPVVLAGIGYFAPRDKAT